MDNAKYTRLYEEFKSDLQPDNIAEWTRMVEQWEKDYSQPDPYCIPQAGQLVIGCIAIYACLTLLLSC